MNRLVIIGNGFDMAHGLKTSYMDFINWYWEQRLNAMLTEDSAVSEDCLCKLEIKNTTGCANWFNFFFSHSLRDLITREWKYPPFEIISAFKENADEFSVTYSQFFGTILQSIETRGWVDIEYDYYQLLKKCTENPDCGYSVKELNEQLAFLQEKLVEYLRSIGTNHYIKELHDAMIEFFDPADFSTEGRKKALENIGLDIKSYEEVEYNPEERNKLIPGRIMLLSFNYTATAKNYNNFNLEHNFIHGDLEHPKNIIFGYGDELDKDYQGILDKQDNELLKNVKSVKYLETRNYHKMLDFLMAAPFQVLIMGHSCGNSDRTLLNTVFEHENCVSIKPFYHKRPDGSDNYLELVQNISRNFTNMRLFRDRVVNKEQCKIM
ncbi:MAG: AbiH family protein [Bacteroidaceae bacterium]|nr:AbiH family protein [Bacteroidaceae bacterium]